MPMRTVTVKAGNLRVDQDYILAVNADLTIRGTVRSLMQIGYSHMLETAVWDVGLPCGQTISLYGTDKVKVERLYKS